jgi:ABC-2 type transport system ATP-binding protein
MLALEVENLVKLYDSRFRPSVRALDGVDLRIEAGAGFGLIGPNGAGKTTLLKALLGVVRPSSGRVRVFGREPDDVAARRRIGYLPERLHLMPAWKPIAYLESIARLRGLTDVRRRAETQLGRVGLAGTEERRIATFSKGMKQRLGLAAALLGEPDLLVLDEPTDGIDPKGRAEVRALLLEERRRGATLFLNSHLLTETEKICDQVAILVAGTVRRAGTMLEVCAHSSRWQLRFAEGAPDAKLRELGFIRAPGEDTFTCEGIEAPALNERLDRARASGALLIELGAETRSLEDVLLELMEGARG